MEIDELRLHANWQRIELRNLHRLIKEKNKLIERQSGEIRELQDKLRDRMRMTDNFRDGYEAGMNMAIEVIRKEITQYG